VEPANPEPAAPAPAAAAPAAPASTAAAPVAAVPAAADPAVAATDVAAAAAAGPSLAGQEQLGRRGERSPRDMALSLAVLLVPIALILIFYRYVLSGDAPVVVDAAPTIQEAQSAQVFPIAVPHLGADWHTASATWQRTSAGGTLRIGYVDPDKDPVQLVESSIDVKTLVMGELTSSAMPLGTFQAGARSWHRYAGRPGEEALVLFEQGRTIIVVGKTNARNLDALASSLS
jgi:hypothetical protein